MKMSFRNQKYVVSIIISLLIVLTLHGISYAQDPAVADRTQQVQDAIVEAVPGIDAAANVTAAHLAAITDLDLEESGIITRLADGDFNGLTGLTTLNLGRNNISYLDPALFSGLTSLTTLKLHELRHDSTFEYKLWNDTLEHLTSLTHLHLQGNKINLLRDVQNPFSNLSNLTYLDLSNCGLTRLPTAVFDGLTSLLELKLNDNAFTSLSNGNYFGFGEYKTFFDRLTALEKLHLNNNGLTTLQGHLFGGNIVEGLTTLTHLYLNDNDFDSLPDGTFTGLTALTELTLPTDTTLPISLEKVADGEFKAVAAAGAPFEIDVPVWVSGGTIDSGATSLTIPIGTVESGTLTVTRTAAPTVVVSANIGTLPTNLPSGHSGYTLTGGGSTLTVIAAVADTTRPTVSITVPSGAQNSAFTVTVTFTEPVTDFVQSELGVGGTASTTVSNFTGSGTTYTARITPTTDGTVTLSVAANVAEDAASNGNIAATTQTVNVDVTRPGVSITAVNDDVKKAAFNVNVVFTETVTGFEQNELSVSGAGATVLIVFGSGATYTATILPARSGTVTLNVAANVAQDTAGNGNTAATPETVTVDMDPPTVSITVPDEVQGGAFPVTVEFNESVIVFMRNELSVSGAGATVGNFRGSGTTYTATITPTRTGTVTLNVAADVAQDAAGNKNTAATPKTVTIDMDPPTVSITVPDEVQGGAFPVTVEFNESVTGFVQNELSVSGAGATVTAFSGTGTTYTATITPTQPGTVTLSVAADVAQDAVGNKNTAATNKTVEIDQTRPEVSINVPSSVQGGAFTVTVVFTEVVTGFVQNELSVSGAGATVTAFSETTLPDSSTTTYEATITPNSTGTVTLSVAADVAQDAVGNKNTAATNKTVEIDQTRPGVTITVPDGVQGGAFDVTVVFTESVDGFVQSELRVSGTAGATVGDFDGSGTTYTATITPTRTGTVTLTIAANVAQDDSDNGNTATTKTVTVDMDPPTVSIDVPSLAQGGAFPVTVEFNESVTGFVESELGVSGAGATVTDFDGDGTTYTATITPTSEGTVTLSVAADVAQDAADNDNTAATPKTVTVDMTPPSVSIDVPTGVQPKTFDVTVEFNESVTGFEQSELDVSGPAGAYVSAFDETTLSGSDTTTYQATITSTESGTVTLNVAENVVSDEAGNSNTAAPAKTVTVDLTRPTVSIDVPDEVQTGEFNVTVEFSESVTGFDQHALRVSGAGATVIDFDGDGMTYTATINPRRSGTVTLNVNAEVAQDNSNNGNAAARTKFVTVDMDRPAVRINPPNGTQIGAFIVEVVFTEPVTGFGRGALEVSGAGAEVSNFFGSGATYTATIIPGETDTVTLNVAENVAQDHVGHWNTAALGVTVRVTKATAGENPLVGRTPEVTAAIAEELGMAPADVETADLADITLLDLRGKLKSGFSNIGQRNLPRNASERLSAQDFVGLLGMEVLVLSDNELKSLPPGIFAGLTSLTHLILSRNELKSLPAGIFNGLTSLTHLRLDDNKLGADKDMTPFDEDVFSNLTNLEILHLNNNKLESLPADIFDSLTGLTKLYLQLNRFTELPHRLFEGLTSLEWLWVEDAQRPLPFPILLEMVGSDQFRVVAPIGAPFEIEVPFVIENGTFTGDFNTDTDGNPILTILAGKLYSEGSLTVAWDEDAIFAAIVKIGTEADFEIEDEFVGEDFFDEDIETLPNPPQWFHQGYKLTAGPRLVFTGLGGKEPPTEEEVALGISPVDEEGNEHLLTGRTPQVVAAIIEEVGANSAADVTAADLAEIEDLLMVGKGITELKAGDFDGLTALFHLSLQANELTSLPEGIFDEGLTKLELLTLTDNKLTSLPENIFDAGLIKLRSLTMSNNELASLPARIFKMLPNLNTLYIRENQLTELPDGIFEIDGNPPLRRLKLDNNPGPGTNRTPFTFPILLEKVGTDQFKAVAPKGATFDYDLGIRVENGAIVEQNLEINTFGDLITTIPVGRVESGPLTVRRTPGTTGAVTVRIFGVPGVKATRPEHDGYDITDFDEIEPLVVFGIGAGAPAFTESLSTVVDETLLLSNYPNPFNPETWIPYQLAEAGDVTVTVYDMRGVVIRELAVGHQPMGVYRSRSRAVHWDGRNQFGEKVATGLYFYTLKAGDFTATRKMLIAK